MNGKFLVSVGELSSGGYSVELTRLDLLYDQAS